MKFQNLFIFVFVIFSLSLNAQITKGTKYLGGSLGFNSYKDKSDGAEAETAWSVSPEFGYFFKDNMSAGILIGVTGRKQGDFTSNGFSSEIYVRKFWNASEKFHIFGGLNVGYGSISASNGSFDSKSNFFSAFIDLGIWYNISDKWSVAGRFGILGFLNTSNPDDDQDGSTEFGFNVSTTNAPFSLGLYYSF
jgi:hypothetical protein